MSILNQLTRATCGMVTFRARNGFCERLINMCASNNISLHNLHKTDEGFEAAILSFDYAKLIELGRKSNVDIVEIARKGVLFKAKRFKGRWGIAIGICLCIVLLFVSTGYIWDVTIKGNVKIGAEEILTELDEIGIKRGQRIKDIDFAVKKQEALLRLPGLAWISLNSVGSRLEVVVSERNAPPLINDTTPCDIVAKKTGQIVHMEVYSGVKIAGERYPVREGDVLVSGTFTSKKGEVSYLHSDAKIIAQVQFDKSLSVDMSQISKQYTGKAKNRYYIEAFGTKLPLFLATKQKGDFDITKTAESLSIFGQSLPFNLTKHHYRFYNKVGENLSEAMAAQILNDGFEQYEALELRDSSVIKREEQTVINADIVTKTVSYTVEEDIGKKVEL